MRKFFVALALLIASQAEAQQVSRVPDLQVPHPSS
jgi:hypothetical protein